MERLIKPPFSSLNAKHSASEKLLHLDFCTQNAKFRNELRKKIGVGKWSKWSFMVMLIPYGHILGYIHHTGLLGELNQHQSRKSLQYFIKVLDDLDRNIICDHL